MENSIEIYEYNYGILLKLFETKTRTSVNRIKGKTHSEYFDKYLNHIKANTIVVENDYIDRDFLEDFSAYYVRCFTDYKRKCTRLHFFHHCFGIDEFESFLENFNSNFKKDLQDNYLGFIVIKPLPETIIGRTCLKTYLEKSESGDKRGFPIVRNYEVNLCGVRLNIKSLAFQEQDSVVSACATSALWSAFQGTGILFHHKILSPVEITKAATKNAQIVERTFPNKGLNVEQMMHAVQELEMEPLVVEINNDLSILKDFVYSYLTFGIPIILGVDVFNTDPEASKEYLGRHAVAITGYRLEKKEKDSKDLGTFNLTSSSMTRIYVHDDQTGPFAKMMIDGKKTLKIKDIKFASLSTEWKHDKTPIGFIRAVPSILLIPLYHKIRISLEKVLELVRMFHRILDFLALYGILPIGVFEWDIFLTNVNKFKEELLSLSQSEWNFKRVLKKNMPRFIWRAKALCDGHPIIDLLFDATDIEQGHILLCEVIYDRDLISTIQMIIQNIEFIPNELKEHVEGKSLVKWINKWADENPAN
ncbi:MAG: hypothetical protein ACM3SY_06285 [Candidatus Omnitrophota bacterium]